MVSDHAPGSPARLVEHFFVGPGKTGTSWLFQFIERRGLASVPTLKEPHIVDCPLAEAEQLIAKLYDSSERMCDFSNTYSGDPGNPQRIKAYNSEARVVVTGRLPSKRIESHYAFSIRNGNPDVGIATYLSNGDHLDMVGRSRFREILDRYVDVFGAGRVLFLPLEELEQDPQSYVNRLTDHLGVDRVVVTEEDRTPVLVRARARNRAFARFASRAGKWLRRRGLSRTLGLLKRSRLIARVMYRTESRPTGGADFGERSDEIARLDEDYRRLVTERLGIDLWKSEE